ncbi:MAG: anion permease, partial [Thermoplasmata archaeon]
LVVVIMSNFVNKTATVAFFVPLVITLTSTISGLGDYTLLLALLIALVAGVAFMTPVAHPPSTLIYGTGIVSKKDMFKSGLAITIPSVLITVVWIYIIGRLGWI